MGDAAKPAAERARAKLIQILAQARYFRSLPEPILGRIAKVARPRKLPAGTVLIEAGTPGDAMYIMATGTVEVLAKHPETGAHSLIATLGTGACFGELSLLSGKPRSATIRARSEVIVLVLSASDFNLLMSKIAPVALAVSQTLAGWLHDLNARAGYRFVRLGTFDFDLEVVRLFSQQMVRRYGAIPLCREGDRITIAMVDPTDLVALDDIQRELGGLPLNVVACAQRDLDRFRQDLDSGVIGGSASDPWSEMGRKPP